MYLYHVLYRSQSKKTLHVLNQLQYSMRLSVLGKRTTPMTVVVPPSPILIQVLNTVLPAFLLLCPLQPHQMHQFQIWRKKLKAMWRAIMKSILKPDMSLSPTIQAAHTYPCTNWSEIILTKLWSLVTWESTTRQNLYITSILTQLKTGSIFSHLSDQPALLNLDDVDVETLLPTTQEEEALKSNFAILVARVLKKHLPFFARFGSSLEQHISHLHTKEMSAKSEVVSMYCT